MITFVWQGNEETKDGTAIFQSPAGNVFVKLGSFSDAQAINQLMNTCYALGAGHAVDRVRNTIMKTFNDIQEGR